MRNRPPFMFGIPKSLWSKAHAVSWMSPASYRPYTRKSPRSFFYRSEQHPPSPVRKIESQNHTTCCMSVILSPFRRIRPGSRRKSRQLYWAGMKVRETYLVLSEVLRPSRTPLRLRLLLYSWIRRNPVWKRCGEPKKDMMLNQRMSKRHAGWFQHRIVGWTHNDSSFDPHFDVII